MIRVKSRNFILIICAILMMLILGVTALYSAIRVSKNYSEEEAMLQIMNNVKFSSSKIKVYGSGNFNDNTPSIDRLSIYDYDVRLSKYGDKVEYNAKFCNENKFDVKFVNFWKDDISCMDALESDISCDNISFSVKAMHGNKELIYGDLIKPNSCIDITISTEYVNTVTSELTFVLSEKNSLELAVVEK